MNYLKLIKSIGLLWLIIAATGCNNQKKDTQNNNRYEGYKITDDAITATVQKEFDYYPEVEPDSIQVESVEGVVHLTGRVDNLLADEKAKEIVSAVKGVKGIIDQLEVVGKNVPDGELEQKIITMLYFDPIAERSDFKVEAHNGKVTITGIVHSWAEKELALDIVRSVAGVKSVNNKINIKYTDMRDDEEIRADVEGILLYDVHVDHELIKVDVTNSVVQLSGAVGSLTEKSEAITDAWVPGVDTVLATELKVESWARDPMMRRSKYTHKPDEDIKAAVEKVLLYDARVNSTELTTEVNNGYVTLSGPVQSLKAKNAAAEDAANVVGVWEVENKLEVRPGELLDATMPADNTRVALEGHPYLSSYDIEVSQNGDKIYLDGTVNNQFEKNEAEKVASSVPGVMEVENNLSVVNIPAVYSYPNPVSQMPLLTRPEIKPDSVIVKNIEKELWWSPFVNENEITVKSDKGNVTLEGTVNTGLEKKMAEANAFEGGAFTVDNNIVVEFGP